MNSNSIVGYSSGTGRNKFAAQTVAAIATTALTVNTDTGTAVAFLSVPQAASVVGSSNPLSVSANPSILSPANGAALQSAGTNRPYFNTDSFNGRAFKVRISGDGTNVTTGQTVSVNIYCGTSATPGSNILVASTGASATVGTAGTYGFFLEATLVWDAATGLVTGLQNGTVSTGSAQVTVASAAISVVPTTVTLPNLQFMAAVVTTAATSTTITVREFALDLV